MNLGDEIAEGLKPLGSSVAVTEECFGSLLDMSIGVILERDEAHPLSLFASMKLDMLKAAYASLLTVFVEAARHNISKQLFVTVLIQDHNFSSTRAEKLVKCYIDHKTELRAYLSHIGNHPPHIVDANWTLDYVIKDNSLDHMGEFQYLIQIHNELCDESVNNKKKVQKIKFICTVEELQDLVSKLKDAAKHIDHVSVA